MTIGCLEDSRAAWRSTLQAKKRAWQQRLLLPLRLSVRARCGRGRRLQRGPSLTAPAVGCIHSCKVTGCTWELVSRRLEAWKYLLHVRATVV